MSPTDPFSTESPEPTPETTPATGAPIRSRRRTVFGGAVLGAMALTASVFAVGAVAGAQDEPAVDGDEPAEIDEMDLEVDETEFDDTEFDDTEFDDTEFDDEAWAAFDECITGQLGDFDEDELERELTDADWEALEQQFEEAEKACEGELPEEVKAELAKFEAYDQCLTDAGLPGEEAIGTIVYIEGDEGGEAIQFGDIAGTVTITGDSSGVTVATEGGVTSFDEEAFEAAFEACDDLLPEDLHEMDEGEFDDEGDLDDEDGDEDADNDEDNDEDGDEDGDDESGDDA
ncbi:MAG: hypothetical protein AAF081_05990 [Actinomycetota bacterium]